MIQLEKLKSVYRKIRFVRLVEEKIMEDYFDDEMKTPVHLSIGEEGVVCSLVDCLKDQNAHYFGTYRNHALYLSITDECEAFFGEMYGKVNGAAKGKAGSMHLSAPEKNLMMCSAIVGSTIPVATGAALAKKYKGEDGLVCVFFGDGALEEGVFFESLNFAALHNLPVLFVCGDNNLAIHSKRQEREGFKSIEALISSFNIHFAKADGTNPESVITSTEALLAKMSESKQPGFLHATYHRFLEHVGPLQDYDKGYRERPSADELQDLDPITSIKSSLVERGISGEFFDELDKELLSEINRCVKVAQEGAFPDSNELYTDVLV